MLLRFKKFYFKNILKNAEKTKKNVEYVEFIENDNLFDERIS